MLTSNSIYFPCSLPIQYTMLTSTIKIQEQHYTTSYPYANTKVLGQQACSQDPFIMKNIFQQADNEFSSYHFSIYQYRLALFISSSYHFAILQIIIAGQLFCPHLTHLPITSPSSSIYLRPHLSTTSPNYDLTQLLQHIFSMSTSKRCVDPPIPRISIFAAGLRQLPAVSVEAQTLSKGCRCEFCTNCGCSRLHMPYLERTQAMTIWVVMRVVLAMAAESGQMGCP